MEQITLRKAIPEDLPVLLTFEAGIVETERPFDGTLKENEIHYYDIAYMIAVPHVEVVVAVAGLEIIGSGYARIEDSKVYLKHPQHAFLGFMYVKPAYRGLGVNQQIIGALKQWGMQQGIREFRLDVYSENEAAVRAYEKAGFSKLLITMRMGSNDNRY